jgi:hypothetical protein
VIVKIEYLKKYILIIIPSYYLLSGGNYRGIYDIGLKGAFMGYRGLLLNDPYKRDRIDGCMLDIVRRFVEVTVSLST